MGSDRQRICFLADCTVEQAREIFYRQFRDCQENEMPKVRALRRAIDYAIDSERNRKKS